METFLQIVIAIQSLGPAWEKPMRFFSFLVQNNFSFLCYLFFTGM
jgi:hypothetical protein